MSSTSVQADRHDALTGGAHTFEQLKEWTDRPARTGEDPDFRARRRQRHSADRRCDQN